MKDAARCQGKNRQTGERCKRAAKKGRKFCRVHGGNLPVGPAHPNWKDGDRSIYLPARMREEYDKAVRDPKRYSYERNLGRLEALAAEIFAKLDQGNTVAQWEAAREEMAKANVASQEADLDGMLLSLNRAWQIFEEGATQERAQEPIRRELLGIMVEIRHTVEAEIKRQHQERLVVTQEQMVAIRARWIEIIARHIRDKKTLGRIADDFEIEAGRFAN